MGIDQCWTRVNSAYDELMEEENDKVNNKFDTDMDYEDDDAEEEEDDDEDDAQSATPEGGVEISGGQEASAAGG